MPDLTKQDLLGGPGFRCRAGLAAEGHRSNRNKTEKQDWSDLLLYATMLVHRDVQNAPKTVLLPVSMEQIHTFIWSFD